MVSRQGINLDDKVFFCNFFYGLKIFVEAPYKENYTFVCNCKITNKSPVFNLKPILNSNTKQAKNNENVAFRVTGIAVLAVILFCLTILVFTFILYKMRHLFSEWISTHFPSSFYLFFLYLDSNLCFRETATTTEIDTRRDNSNDNNNNNPLNVNKIDKPPSYTGTY